MSAISRMTLSPISSMKIPNTLRPKKSDSCWALWELRQWVNTHTHTRFIDTITLSFLCSNYIFLDRDLGIVSTYALRTGIQYRHGNHWKWNRWENVRLIDAMTLILKSKHFYFCCYDHNAAHSNISLLYEWEKKSIFRSALTWIY